MILEEVDIFGHFDDFFLDFLKLWLHILEVGLELDDLLSAVVLLRLYSLAFIKHNKKDYTPSISYSIHKQQ